MADGELEAAAAAAWAEALGCDLRLLGEPGAHMVPGGAWLRGRNAVYMAGVRAAVLVYCPGRLRRRAAAVLASTPPGHLFTPDACARIADVGEAPDSRTVVARVHRRRALHARCPRRRAPRRSPFR